MSRPARVAGCLLAAVIVVAGSLGALAAARDASSARAAADRSLAAEGSRRLSTVLAEAGLVVRVLADGPAREGVTGFRAAAPRLVDGTALRATSLATLTDAGPRIITTSPAPRPPLVRGAVVDVPAAVGAARADLAPAFGQSGDGSVLVVAPVTTARADAPVAERRQGVHGLVVGLIDVERVLNGMFRGADVRLDADGTTLYRRGDAEGSVLRTTVDAGEDPWDLWVDGTGGGTGSAPWLILAGAVVLAAMGGIALARAVEARTRAAQLADDRMRQLARIADTGGRIQQTLDLGELLPAFAIGLADEFDLRHVSISLVDDEGRDVEAFATGDRAAGADPFELPLRRGWRHVGMLRVRPRRPLDDAERTSIQALGDLLAVALTNARLLQREKEATTRLRELDALKNAFLGTVSHELRTSMTAIMGFGELLVDAWDELADDRRRELAERVRCSAGSLRHLVDDLLDFARLEQQRLRVSPREVDLADTVRHTAESLHSLLADRGLDLRTTPTPAFVDPVAVERIVANLLSNAAKYSPAGSTVTVTVEPAADRARLVVADQGPGIPAAERSRIFVRFYRLDTEATLRTRGAGIGLSILRDFADRSGATVVVDDAPGGGARFTIDFPASPTPLPEERPVPERSAP